jgi:prepilin-type N-terminal cleavage/methylation domain-containing protein
MKKSAFTLIELLVVISIIAILAGIALPVFGAVMERGKATADLSNLRQLGIGTIAFLADNNDQIYSSADTTPWPVNLYSKYVPNWKTFKSPFDIRGDVAITAAGTGIPVSFGINPNVLTGANATPPFDGNSTKYSAPSQLILIADNVDTSNIKTVAFVTKPGTGAEAVQLPPPTTLPPATKGNLGTFSKRKLINVLYADAHGSSITYLEYSTAAGTDAAGFRWQPLYPIP